ncbi:hypothetical protein F7725_003426 [Dissostichus mawsoni]|uniref:Uncharacterized protein n=1 Tax=Dissostichus mawsoni TaxID=36200 RepID=A0A7J5YDI9_DISMA|nr:hypothetical protein F7725_003426 [Dissostichus mawsoni]
MPPARYLKDGLSFSLPQNVDWQPQPTSARSSRTRAVGKAAEHPETMDSLFSGKSASASKEPREGSDSPDPPLM